VAAHKSKLKLELALPEKWFGGFWPSRSPTVREGSRSKFWQKPEPLLTRGLLLGTALLSPLTLFGQGRFDGLIYSVVEFTTIHRRETSSYSQKLLSMTNEKWTIF
jgi:hypothetical protein